MQDPHAADKELIGRCLAGGPSGDTPGVASPWDPFFAAYAPFLQGEVRFALRRFGLSDDPDRVRDLSQEVYHALMEDGGAILAKFRWNCSLKRYLAIVAVSRVANVLTRDARTRNRDLAAADAPGWARLLAEDGRGDNGLSGPERREIQDEVRQALARLSPNERLSLQLHYCDDHPVSEIARLLAMTDGAVRVALHRARHHLRELLKRTSFCL